MASAMASSAAHHIPPMVLPAVPRVRPPRIPKGTPQGNTLPQPAGEVPTGMVWADGRWRHPDSRSARHKQAVQSRQVEKALRHRTHGMNIYAYSHVRTNQVVYSLSKNMQNNKILPQLLYHGKKTVPEAIRRDLWRPYFSIHFPQTEAGAAKGLRVYRDLRELSVRRQISPPEELLIATQADLDNTKRRFDPVTLKEVLEAPGRSKLKLPIPGQKLPKRQRAKRLMDQKATSVADVAAVLTFHDHVNYPGRMDELEHDRKERDASLGLRAHKRLGKIRTEEANKSREIEARQELVDGEAGRIKLSQDASRRLSVEFEGGYGAGRVTDMEVIKKSEHETANATGAAMELEALLREMQSEKVQSNRAIRGEMIPAIKRRLAALSTEERNKIDQQIRDEKSTAEERLEARHNELQKQLTSRLDRLVQAMEQDQEALRTATDDNRKDIRARFEQRRGELRKAKRQDTSAILSAMHQERSKELRYFGPFAEVQEKLDETMKQIDERYKPRIDALREEVQLQNENAQSGVEIRWADIRAATYAQDWPETVIHEVLQPKTAVKKEASRIETHAYIDEDEHDIAEQSRPGKVQIGSSVHVFGSVQVDEDGHHGWYLSPKEFAAIEQERRPDRESAWDSTERILARREIVRLRDETRKAAGVGSMAIGEAESADGAALQDALDSAWTSLPTTEEAVGDEASSFDEWLSHAKYLIPRVKAERRALVNDPSSSTVDESAESLEPLHNRLANLIKYAEVFVKQMDFESTYPHIRTAADRQQEWERQIQERASILLSCKELMNNSSRRDEYRDAQERLESFDQQFPDVARMEQDKRDISTSLARIVGEMTQAEEDLAQAHAVAMQATAKLVEAEQEAKVVDGADLSGLQAAADNAKAAVESQLQELADLQTQQADEQARLDEVEHSAWLQFKRDGGVDEFRMLSSKTKPETEDVQSLKDAGVEVPSPRPGVWARIKAMFGSKNQS